jgi:hypothetical protein
MARHEAALLCIRLSQYYRVYQQPDVFAVTCLRGLAVPGSQTQAQREFEEPPFARAVGVGESEERLCERFTSHPSRAWMGHPANLGRHRKRKQMNLD